MFEIIGSAFHKMNNSMNLPTHSGQSQKSNNGKEPQIYSKGHIYQQQLVNGANLSGSFK